MPRLPKNLLRRPKSAGQTIYDLVFAPLRMLLPDEVAERFGLSSLRTERMAVVLQNLNGRCLDVGAHDNELLRTYGELSGELGIAPAAAGASVGVDVVDWGADTQLIPDSAHLPFDDGAFDCVAFIACLNHIPERADAIIEARRVMHDDGRLLITMISRFVGGISHRLRWWGEHSHRDVHVDELLGMNEAEIMALAKGGGFELERTVSFYYGMNKLHIFKPRHAGGA